VWIPLLLVVVGCQPTWSRAAAGNAGPNSPKVSGEHADDLAGLVNPFIGTATIDGAENDHFNAGDTFPGATFPFGMVQLSADNTREPGGYDYGKTRIDAFSLTHFSGRGVACWQDIGVMPTVGEPTASPGEDWTSNVSPFRHSLEHASAGRYHVTLDEHAIDVDLTVTPRTGMLRFGYPPGEAPTVLVDAGHSAQGNSGTGTGVRVVPPNRIEGSAESGDCGGTFRYRVFFVAEFDRPFARFGTWNGGAVTPGRAEASGADTGAFLTFDPSQTPLQMRVGISFVGIEGAARNLAAENAGWDFEAVAGRARMAWNERLGRIEVRGGTREQRQIFYTALYHTMLHPNLFSDIDGSALGLDGRVHVFPAGRPRYENFATWDDYRSELPLLAIIAPLETADMMASLIAMAEEDPGGGLPRWQQAAGNSGGMVGDGADIELAEAYAFGARGFDAHAALRSVDRGASVPGTRSGGHLVRQGLEAYLKKGYVPYDDSRTGAQSASITLEYATADFAIAQLADALGETAIRDRFRRRAGSWRNLWRSDGGGLLVPRLDDGRFAPDVGPATQQGFVEGNAEQYLWMVPFDLPGVVTALGGPARAVGRLDAFFAELNAGMDRPHYFFGNEPGEGTPWVYAFAGAPAKTQAVVRRILRELFLDEPRGLPGNDDAGALSSWAVFACLGLYPAVPGVGGFVVGSPLFPEATVHLGNGHRLEIVARGAAADAPFVAGLRLDNRPYDHVWIPWEAVAGGARLDFELSRTAASGLSATATRF
jgi:predicted alpha-1,2-mannosidase